MAGTEEPIDFVITWVDGSDSDWLDEKNRYARECADSSWKEWVMGDKRYRDWGLLRHWFRAIEKYAPWVNMVHFVTWGHVPTWLNVDNPKIHIVKHGDFIPEDYLPTFNSHAIELNLHRISGLAEQFVYFNDDLYLTSPVGPRHFFRNHLPCDFATLGAAKLDRERTSYSPYVAMILNDHFDMKQCIKSHLGHWFNFKYGLKCNLRTLSLVSQSKFPGIYSDHLTSAFLKSSFDEVWDVEFEELDRTCRDRFRGFYGIPPGLVRDWQRVEGAFVPRRCNFGKAFVDPAFFKSDENLNVVIDAVVSGRYKVICINDEIDEIDRYERWGRAIRNAFDEKLPERSSFEIA